MLQVVILAGGLATRLRPISEKIPKSLIEINGEPFIFHQLRLLKSKGFEKVIICAGYLGNMIEDIVGNGEKFNLDVVYSFDGEVLLGTGGAIRNAFPLLDEKFMITYGDSYLDFDYAGLNSFVEQNQYPAVMTIFKNQDLFDTSNVLYNNGKILYSKMNRSADMNYIDYGFSTVSKKIFNSFNKFNIFDLSVIFEKLSVDGQLGAFEVTNRFYEIGSFQGITDIESYLKKTNSI
jgi:NDP-sugar pyrophosphorylase family protein